jgi:hypothetical protein
MWGQPPSAVRSSEARRPIRGGRRTETQCDEFCIRAPFIKNAQMPISTTASIFIGENVSSLRVARDRVREF